MDKIIAYCGINCAVCPACLASQSGNLEEIEKVAKEWSIESMSFKPEDIICDGCINDTRIFSWCSECPIRSCCREKGYENCASCNDFYCENLKNTFEKTPSAKETLEKIRKNLLKPS
jgi:hypothetical protein